MADDPAVGPIDLLDNPLLKLLPEPAHIKPRLPGHCGTTPGRNQGRNIRNCTELSAGGRVYAIAQTVPGIAVKLGSSKGD